MQHQQLIYEHERGFERLTDSDDAGEDLTTDSITVARLKDERDQALQRVQELEAELNIPWRPQPGHAPAPVTLAQYEKMLEENARYVGFFARIGLELDKMRYASDLDAMMNSVYRLLADKQLQPLLFPGDKEAASLAADNDKWSQLASQRPTLDDVIRALAEWGEDA